MIQNLFLLNRFFNSVNILIQSTTTQKLLDIIKQHPQKLQYMMSKIIINR